MADEASWRLQLDAGKQAGKLGDYAGAEKSFLAALHEAEMFGPRDPRLAETLNLLGLTYTAQQRPQEAEVALTRALEIRKAVLGASHADTSVTRVNLANVLFMQGRRLQAEKLYLQAIAAIERESGQRTPALEGPLISLSTLYLAQHQASQAEPLVRLALAISEAEQGAEGLRVQEHLHQLASVLLEQRKYAEAAAAASRAAAINRKVLGSRHPQVAISLQILGRVHTAQGLFVEAEADFVEALGIFEESVGPGHPLFRDTLRYYAASLRLSNREAEAAEAERRANASGP